LASSTKATAILLTWHGIDAEGCRAHDHDSVRRSKARYAARLIVDKRLFYSIDEIISAVPMSIAMRSRGSLLPLTAIRAFHAAGSASSFKEAAHTLSVTPSAISHQVRILEHWLGKPLFERRTREVVLTRDGRAFLKVVGRSFDLIDAVAVRLRGSDGGSSTLRLSATQFFVSTWLIPRLEAFERSHPGINLEIDGSNRLVDFSRETIDLAIRNARGRTPGLENLKLLDLRPVPLCTAKLRDQLESPADLAKHTLIHVSARRESWPRWLAAVGCSGLRARRDLTFDSALSALEAAARGRGIALGMDPITWDAPAASKLVRALPERVEGTSTYYLVYRKSDITRPSVRACVDWLLAEAAAYKRRLSPR
jgi:LysR family glycine cleavage system transcriptional activator